MSRENMVEEVNPVTSHTVEVEEVQETTVPTVVILEPTPEQQAILNIIKMVESDLWCRNTVNNGAGQRCMLGLMQAVTR